MGAVIGYLEIEVSIPHARSLKEKRSFVKKLVERLRNNFNASVSEVGKHDSWRSAVIGIAVVGNNSQVIDSYLEKIIDYAEKLYPGSICYHHKEIF